MATKKKKKTAATPVELRELGRAVAMTAERLWSDDPDLEEVVQELESHLKECKKWPVEDS